MRNWSWKDSAELYQVANWGAGFFGINERGHVQVTPRGPEGPAIDLYELLPVNETTRQLILKRSSADIIREAAVKQGMRTLREDGWRTVRAGTTTVAEVVRVTQEEV